VIPHIDVPLTEYAESPPLARRIPFHRHLPHALPDPPAPKSLPLPSPALHTRITALLLPFLSFLLSSFRRRFPAEPDTIVSNSIPSCRTRRPSARPLLAFRSTTPQEGWEQALLDLPEGEGAPGFALNPKSSRAYLTS
jgi:hypothetical protein